MPGYDLAQILEIIPHRSPFLLIDRIDEVEIGRHAVGIKNVTADEWFFQGHFPAAPIMPGVLQIEALAQAAGILGIETMELAGTGKLVIFMGIENAKFRSPVTPGCLLDLHVEFTQKRSRVYKFNGVASVEGKTTCEVEFTAMMTDAL